MSPLLLFLLIFATGLIHLATSSNLSSSTPTPSSPSPSGCCTAFRKRFKHFFSKSYSSKAATVQRHLEAMSTERHLQVRYHSLLQAAVPLEKRLKAAQEAYDQERSHGDGSKLMKLTLELEAAKEKMHQAEEAIFDFEQQLWSCHWKLAYRLWHYSILTWPYINGALVMYFVLVQTPVIFLQWFNALSKGEDLIPQAQWRFPDRSQKNPKPTTSDSFLETITVALGACLVALGLTMVLLVGCLWAWRGGRSAAARARLRETEEDGENSEKVEIVEEEESKMDSDS